MDLNVRLTGADQTLKALDILEPSVARRVKKEISSIGATMASYITSLAQADAPVSGWVGTPSWPAWTAVTGSSSRRGAGVVVTPRSSDARIASMYEYIGNATKIRTPQGATLSRMFNERLGVPVSNSRRKRPGRLVRQTLNDKYAEARQDIERACDEAVAEVNRRMP
mgnify:CR=1 FL=1|jgi:hypothetical protein